MPGKSWKVEEPQSVVGRNAAELHGGRISGHGARVHSVSAHGFFECYDSLADVTVASFFSEKGKKTPVYARFSAEAAGLGFDELKRGVRGFSVRFVGQDAWDLIGLDFPVFFIQDAAKFPAFVRAAKFDPRSHASDSAAARDAFWDFVSLAPESAHALMWLMSDRGIPCSYRMMQGFGVQVFRFVNAKGEARFVKFLWNPVLGTHSHTWDEAARIYGADPDYYWRDLWEAVDSGNCPEWELGIQMFTARQAEQFSFDVLDATKLIPEELVPVMPVGRIVLNRNPDDIFAGAVQVAFCAAQTAPGIELVADPLFARLVHAYADVPAARTERASGCPAAPCAFLSSIEDLMSCLEPVMEDGLRGNPDRRAEFGNQARLFYESQTEFEKRHIIDAYAFELGKVTAPAVRYRMVAMLRDISDELARGIVKNLGMALPDRLAPVFARDIEPEVIVSPALSLTARPGEASVRTRKVAVLVADGVDGSTVSAIAGMLVEAGAIVRLVGSRIGPFAGAGRFFEQADASFTTHPGVVFDGVVVPDGSVGVAALCASDQAVAFVQDQFRHGKSLLAVGAGSRLLEAAGISSEPGDAGLVLSKDTAKGGEAFIKALSGHRHPDRGMVR